MFSRLLALFQGRKPDLGDEATYQVNRSGLKYKDTVEGTGDQARAGHTVTVHYAGWLRNGKQFDSSLSRREPFKFTLGTGRVIKGWDEGVAGMKVGGTRMLIVPAALGYGSRGAGSVIPPQAELVFEVRLLAVEQAPVHPE